MPPRAFVNYDRVRQLLAKGLTQTQVATRLGCCKQVVCYIAKGTYPPAQGTKS